MEIDAKAIAAREATKNAGFDKWMADPLVRMSISMIPAGEHKDALQMLLRSAFDAGHDIGQGAMAATFLTALLDGERKRPR